jgi:crotonobetainyl-CoA:carnitine CoA-transferase CaiB-like acyl-CoA transferase
MSGLAALNAGPDGAPRYLPTVAADKITGHMLATAIGTALFHRERTGQGQEVHVPMMETILSFVLVEHMWYATLGEPERGVLYPRMMTPHRRPYATQDGHLCVIAHTDEQWRRLFAAIGRPELVEDPRFTTIQARAEHVDAAYGVLTEAMRGRTTEDWVERLNAADIPNGRANTVADLFDDAYLQETGFFRRFEHPVEGRYLLTEPPVSFSAAPASIRLLPPTLGQHTRAVLTEAGLSNAEILDIAG